jgi:hypothetical protein
VAPGQIGQCGQQCLRMSGEIRHLHKFDTVARVPRGWIGVLTDHDHRNALLAQ